MTENIALFSKFRSGNRPWHMLLFALITFGITQLLLSSSHIDDAFVSFRYALNWAQGHGIVYNPDAPPVEGYTNFLWVVFLYIGAKIGIAPPLFAKILGFIFGILSLVLIWDFPRVIPAYREQFKALSISPLIIALFAPFTIAMAQGLEEPLLVFLLVALLWVLPQELEGRLWKGISPFIVLSLALVRPDGILFAIPVIGVLVALAFFSKQYEKNARRLLVNTIIVVALGVTIHYLWRFSYYGEWQPNTFYAKAMRQGSIEFAVFITSFIKRLSSVITGFWGEAGGGILLLFFALSTLVMHGQDRWWKILCAGLLLARFVFVAAFGEAYMGFWRFQMPTFILALILSELGVRSIIKNYYRPEKIAPVFLFMTVLFCIFLSFKSVNAIDHAVKSGQYMRQSHYPMAKWLRENSSPKDSFAFFDAGVVPYESGLHTIDLGGLTEYNIARIKGYRSGSIEVGEYVLNLEPKYIIMWATKPWPEYNFEHAYDPTTKTLQTMPEFRERYEYVIQFSNDSSDSSYYLIFRKKSL